MSVASDTWPALVSYSVWFFEALVGSEDADGIGWVRAFGNETG
jgi:hypothetical protein